MRQSLRSLDVWQTSSRQGPAVPASLCLCAHGPPAVPLPAPEPLLPCDNVLALCRRCGPTVPAGVAAQGVGLDAEVAVNHLGV